MLPGLLLCLLAGIEIVTVAFAQQPERVVGTDVLYTMGHEGCRAGQILDTEPAAALGALYLNETYIACPDGNGLRHPGPLGSPPEEAGSIEGIGPPKGGVAYATSPFSVLSTSAIKNVSMDLWLSVASRSTDNQMAVVFSICSEDVVRLKVFQMNAKLFIQFTAPSTTGYTILDTNVDLPLNAPPTAMHLVITAESFTALQAGVPRQRVTHRVYFNGAFNVSTNQRAAMDNRPNYWNQSDRLYLFSEPASVSVDTVNWPGSLHLWALYNRSLTLAEVRQNYAARVPNSRPVVLPAIHVVQENGEVGTHFDTPEFYLSPLPVDELVVLTLEVLDGDHDPASPNYNASTLATTMPLLYLATLPANGTLYYLNGTAITGSLPVSLDVTVANDSTSSAFVAHMRYRPGWKEVSWPAVYTTFSFYALDGATGLASDTATVSVQVRTVHDIPKAGILDEAGNVTFLSLEAMAGRLTAATLMGTASEGFSIITAQIASLPAHGHLYRLNDIKAITPLQVGDELVVTPIAPAQVSYLYTGPQLLAMQSDDSSTHRAASTNNTLATDIFTYTVTDDFDASSVPASVNLVVVPSLVALPAVSTPVVPENTLTPVRLYGVDYQSLEHRNLCFDITALPHHGTLRISAATDTITDAAASVPFRLHGQVSSYPYETGVTVHYISDAGFFTQPNQTWNGSALFPQGGVMEGFDFRVVACDGDQDDAISASISVQQQVTVQNVNDAIELAAPSAHLLSVLGLGALDVATNTSGGEVLQGHEDVLTLTGWQVVDTDLDVDPVLVRISALYGIVRLNPQYLFLADFASVRCQIFAEDGEIAPSSLCQGSGEDRAMVFVASPAHLQLLLEGMEYRSATTNVVDIVRVAVYDGQTVDGGQDGCLPARAFNSTSLWFTGCWVATANVTVHVGPSALLLSLNSSNAKHKVPSSLWFALWGWLLFMTLAGATAYWHRRQRS